MSAPAGARPDARFVHEAFLYTGEAEFLAVTVPFVRAGLEADEPVLVVVEGRKIRALREALGVDADRAHFADMADVGVNPARIIPFWRAFVSEHTPRGRRARGIGEPVSADRRREELVECQRHEDLLNVAFSDDDAWWLLCPYDTSALETDVVEEARRSHPFLRDVDGSRPSDTVRSLEEMAAPFREPLPDPPPGAERHVFAGVESLPLVRRLVAEVAAAAGLDGDRSAALILAADELAANSIRHAHGGGALRVWAGSDVIVCEVRDDGHISAPLAGRVRPPLDQPGGRGLWLANQLCDLVQVRSFPTGNVVRLHMRLG